MTWTLRNLSGNRTKIFSLRGVAAGSLGKMGKWEKEAQIEWGVFILSSQNID